jgi:hypothetical protein
MIPVQNPFKNGAQKGVNCGGTASRAVDIRFSETGDSELGVRAYWMAPTIPLGETFEGVMRPTESGPLHRASRSCGRRQ